MLTVDRAVLLARACSLAFLPPTAIPSSPLANGLRFVGQVEDPASQAGATVLRVRDSDETIIACRGSASTRNFQCNFNVGPAKLSTPNGPHPTATVHAGFQAASKELWQRLAPLLPDTGPLVCTGHSLGGGTATLISLNALAAGRDAPELVTVAGPRLGNDAFASYYREVNAKRATHLVHSDDDVLKSNQKLWNECAPAALPV